VLLKNGRRGIEPKVKMNPYFCACGSLALLGRLGWSFCGIRLDRSGCEARSELHNWAWLRWIFGMRWVKPRCTDPD
jgi:hypothetical protein